MLPAVLGGMLPPPTNVQGGVMPPFTAPVPANGPSLAVGFNPNQPPTGVAPVPPAAPDSPPAVIARQGDGRESDAASPGVAAPVNPRRGTHGASPGSRV